MQVGPAEPIQQLAAALLVVVGVAVVGPANNIKHSVPQRNQPELGNSGPDPELGLACVARDHT